MIKNKRCTKFKLDESTGKCKHYGGSEKHLAACYDDCKKRMKKETEKNDIRKELEKCYVGVAVE